MKYYYRLPVLLVAIFCLASCSVIGFSVGAAQDKLLAEQSVKLNNIHSDVKVGDSIIGIITQPMSLEPFEGLVLSKDTTNIIILFQSDTNLIRISDITQLKKKNHSQKKILYGATGLLLIDVPGIAIFLLLSNLFPFLAN